MGNIDGDFWVCCLHYWMCVCVCVPSSIWKWIVEVVDVDTHQMDCFGLLGQGKVLSRFFACQKQGLAQFGSAPAGGAVGGRMRGWSVACGGEVLLVGRAGLAWAGPVDSVFGGLSRVASGFSSLSFDQRACAGGWRWAREAKKKF